MLCFSSVTPCVGVWIEMLLLFHTPAPLAVTPCVGVWIEIYYALYLDGKKVSLPAWECGLKSDYACRPCSRRGHSLRGSVD